MMPLAGFRIKHKKLVMDSVTPEVLPGAVNRHGSLWNEHVSQPFLLSFVDQMLKSDWEVEHVQTCLPKDETVECNSHGPHVQRL